uniref:C-type lectin domain-containing protein n=1 Tax=Globodera pallida TaxID=36090 RepID=A0A183CEA6_GLOPA
MRLLLLIVLSLAIVLLSSAHEEPPKPCPEGYSLYNKYCYKAFTNPDKVVKYSEAEKQCKSEGAELASVHNELEREYLLLLKDLYGKQMSEKDKKKVCALYTSEYVKTKDEPKNAQEYLDKLLEKTKTSYSDSSDHMYCKFNGVLGACGESCWKNVKPSCSEGYEYFNGNCYKAFTNADKVVKYSEAEKRCKSEDAELVSLHNELEREYVNVLVLNEAKKNEYNSKKPGLAFYWTGMKLEWEEKKLVKASWTDGKPMDYLNPTEWGTEKRPVFLDNAGGGGYNKENENCVFLGQWPREAKDYMKLDSALEKHGLDVLLLDVNCEKPGDYWGPRGAVCQKKPKADECYGGYSDGGGSVEDEEVKKLVTYVTVGSGTFLYTEKNTYMLLQLKGKYGKEMGEEDRKKVCAYYKAEYVKGKDEPKKTQEYVDKVLEKEKTSYSDSTDHMLCKFTGVLGACGSSCKKGY